MAGASLLKRLAALPALALWAVAAPAAAAELRYEGDRETAAFGTVAVLGLPAAALARLGEPRLASAAAAALLEVRTAAAGDGLPAVLGRLSVADGVLRFRPRFPFRQGLAYRARFDGRLFDGLTGQAATADLALTFEPPPAASAPATRVEAIFPSAEVLPENQLRLYVWFSAPMRGRRVADGVRLIDVATGEAVDLPFVEIQNGLWDPSGRRLTLFFHPGRVKRGVGPNRALGPPLVRGRRYRLEIDAGLHDAAGRPLAAGFSKSFSVGPADRRPPEPAGWRLAPPSAPDGELVVDFPEPLDHALLLRLLEVVDAGGEVVAGEGRVSRGETRWSLRPRSPWRPGPHYLRVPATLEDLAGNTPERLFDRATGGDRRPGPPRRSAIDLPFGVTG